MKNKQMDNERKKNWEIQMLTQEVNHHSNNFIENEKN